MKTNYLILLAVAVSGTLFAILAPANIKDKLIGVATFATNERQCFNFHKSDFNDPDSAYLEDSFIWTKEDELSSVGQALAREAYLKHDAILNIKVRAKNRMGAYVQEYVECPLVNGRFDESAAASLSTDPLASLPAVVEMAAPASEN